MRQANLSTFIANIPLWRFGGTALDRYHPYSGPHCRQQFKLLEFDRQAWPTLIV